MFKSAEISSLQEKVSKLEAELASATSGQATLQTQLDQARASLLNAQASADVVTRLRSALANVRSKLTAIAGSNVTVAKAKVKTKKKNAEGEEEEGEEDEDDGETEARACVQLADQLTSKASVDAQVTQRLAAAGVDPIKRDPQAKDSTGSGKPQAETSGTPRQRTAAAMGAWAVFSKN